MKKKLQNLLEELNHGLVERQEAVKLSLLAALANEHMLLVGPPGTGKSMIARRISECFNNSGAGTENDYFEYLLTKFSTPEEIFGPLSISELKADRFKRNTAGYLPTVKVAFLDEIFKASSSILNALLTILNERIYHNGTDRQKVPLQSLIAASNELPVGQDELNALYDRFLVRCFVDYVSTESLPRFFESGTSAGGSTHLGEADLKAIQDMASAVTLPVLVQDVIREIWIQHKETFKEDRREQLSDRRLKKLIHLLRVAAATNDRSEVDLSDLLLLKNCLWNHPDNSVKVQKLVLDMVRRYSHAIPLVEGDADESTSIEARLVSSQVKGNVVKGYLGSGTEQDPILVGTSDELLGLSRSQVGMKGYHFRQTSDIDCSGLTSWNPISFTGSYNGAGFEIKNRDVVPVSIGMFWSVAAEPVRRVLFSTIEPNSRIFKLKLSGFDLATTANGANIEYCESDGRLIASKAQDCQFAGCLTDDSLIGGEAVACVITRCQAGAFLIHGSESTDSYARNCTISDSLVVVDYFGSKGESRGGLVQYLTDNSLVERCLVTGKCSYSGEGYFDFSGIAFKCESSKVRCSALGPLETSSTSVRIRNRIVGYFDFGDPFHNNAATDRVVGSFNSLPDGLSGSTVPAAAFNQYFFEHTLDWDFYNVWRWDQKTNLPALQDVGVNGVATHAVHPKQTSSINMMSRQLRANIWC